MSKRGGSSKGGANAKQISTASGITYEQFMNMSVDEREQAIVDILNNENIAVPDYLDNSATQKVLYALGMSGKPDIISDEELDKLDGRDYYRTVTDNKYLNANDILEQISKGDFTRMSDSGGSAYGRGIYFANDLEESLSYGYKGESSVMRIKLKKDAKIAKYSEIGKSPFSSSIYIRMEKGVNWNKASFKADLADYDSLKALSKGYDGWYDAGTGYLIMLNRSKFVTSKTYKRFKSWNDDTWSKMANAN